MRSLDRTHAAGRRGTGILFVLVVGCIILSPLSHATAQTSSAKPAPRAHSSIVVDAAFSSDGKRFMTAGFEGAIKVWDAENGQLLSFIDKPAHANLHLASAAFSPDGNRVVAGYEISTRGGTTQLLRAWDGTGKPPVFSQESRVYAIWPFASSKDGCTFATTHNESPCKLKIWRVADGQCKVTHDLPVTSYPSMDAVAFSPDGTMIATVGSYLRLWKADTGEQVRVVEAKSRVRFYSPGVGSRSLCFSPDGKTLAYGITDDNPNARGVTGTVIICSVPKLTEIKRINRVMDGVRCLAFVDSSTIVVGGYVGERFSERKGRVATIDLKRDPATQVFKFKDEDRWSDVSCVAVSPDGKKLLVGEGGGIRLLNIDGTQLLRIEAEPEKKK